MNKKSIKLKFFWFIIVFILKINSINCQLNSKIKFIINFNNFDTFKNSVFFFSTNKVVNGTDIIKDTVFDRIEINQNKIIFYHNVEKDIPYQIVILNEKNNSFLQSNFLFFKVEDSLQEITISKKDKNIIIDYNNIYTTNYNIFFSKLKNITDSLTGYIFKEKLKDKYKIIDSFLNYPDFQIPIFWELFFDFRIYDDDDTIIHAIDKKIEYIATKLNNFEYINQFKNKINFRNTINVGKKFNSKLYNFSSELDSIINNSNFTFIDYWATWCKPCINSFPKIKNIYSKFHNKKFSVISISIDDSNNTDKVNLLVKDKKLPWKNFIDNKGNQTKKILELGVPFYILLNNKGIILYKGLGEINKENIENLFLKN